MKLLTKRHKTLLVKNHKEQQIEDKERKIIVKLFYPASNATWYLTELDPDTNIAYGLCILQEKERGYVSLDELANFKGQFGLGIERDKSFPINEHDMSEFE